MRKDRSIGLRPGMVLLLSALVIGLVPAAGHAAPGDYDSSFSGDGVASVAVRDSNGGFATAFDASGRIVTAGFTAADDGPAAPLLTRHLPSGSLDSSFSGDGIAVPGLGAEAYATAVAVDSAGRIVFAAVRGATATDVAVVRLTPAGSLDPTFHGDGIALVDLGTTDLPIDLQVDEQDRPVVTGASDGRAFVIRLTASGNLDATFSGDGSTLVGPGGLDRGTTVVVDAPHVIVGGVSDGDVFIARLTAGGAPDTTFSGDGLATSPAAGSGVAAAVNENGAITFAADTGADLLVGRFTPSGSADPTFSGDGRVVVNTGGSESVGGLVVDASGRAVVSGARGTSEGIDGLVAIFTSSGTLDTGYSGNGWSTLDLGGDELLAGASAGPAGRIALAGQAFDAGASSLLTVSLQGGTSPNGPRPDDDPFVDDDDSIFEDDIEALARAGITKGCNPPINDRYCPDDPVTRGQMAAFLVRALGYTDRGPTNLFTDDNDSVFEADIDKLGTAGVTKGCNPPINDRYCPDDPVTRGQMAAFLVRALGYTDRGPTNLFTDDNDSVFEADIDKLGTAGVTKGCNPPINDRYCPDDPVTRGQMAAFLVRALDLR